MLHIITTTTTTIIITSDYSTMLYLVWSGIEGSFMIHADVCQWLVGAFTYLSQRRQRLTNLHTAQHTNRHHPATESRNEPRGVVQLLWHC